VRDKQPTMTKLEPLYTEEIDLHYLTVEHTVLLVKATGEKVFLKPLKIDEVEGESTIRKRE